MTRLCAECAAESARWLDYCPTWPIKITSHGPDGPGRGVAHGARVIETIRTQQRLIRDHCARHHAEAEL